jgi:hypothetical protein
VTISLQVSDNLSGVGFDLFVVIAPPDAADSNAVQSVSRADFQLVSGTVNNGTWQAVKTMPRYSPSGAWHIQYVILDDSIGNFIVLDTSQLQAAGIDAVLNVNATQSDITPPALTSLSFTPPLIDSTSGPQNVVVTMSAADDLSGLAFDLIRSGTVLFYFASPSGNQAAFPQPFLAPTPVAGTPMEGTWQMNVQWPQFAEEGTWRLTYMLLIDGVGNEIYYSTDMLQAMGLPTDVVVTRPSLNTDGTVGPAGGPIIDSSFGPRASIYVPPGLLSAPTNVALDVFPTPLPVPTPQGFTAPGTYFVNISLTPSPGSPISAPGIEVILPLKTAMTPGARLSLYHIYPLSGKLAPAMDASHHLAVGTVNGDGLSATFLNVVTLSTVAGYLSNGSVLGDVDGSGSLNCTDVSLLRASFGRRKGQAGFNSAADLNNDGVVDIRDLIVINRQLPAGTTCQ